jgi:hypothetical protein
MVNFRTATAAMSVDEDSNQVSMLTGLVKFDGKFANRVQNPVEVPEFLHKLYIKLQRVDPTFQMGDKSGTIMAMDAIPDTLNECIDKFNLQVISKRDHQHLMFVVTFVSKKAMSVLKNASMDLLRRNNLFMNRHALDAAVLDVAIAGWIFGAHPRYHSPTVQKSMMEEHMHNWWDRIPNESRRQWATRLNIEPKEKLAIPEFFLNARAIKANDGSGQTTHESTLLVMAAAKTSKLLVDLMEEVFQPMEEEDSDAVHFIPARLQQEDAKTFYNLVQQQSQYLRTFQNISIAGVHKETMELEISITDPDGGKQVTTSLEMAFLLHPAIHRVDPGSFIIPLGKWNFSTTKDQAEEAKKWIDHVITRMPATQRYHTNFADFPQVTRMKMAPKKDPSRYAKLYKPMEETAAAVSGPSTRNDRSFSQNPQEAAIPPLLSFEYKSQNSTTNPTSSYAKAASRNTTPTSGSTQISTMTPDLLRTFEKNMKTLFEDNMGTVFETCRKMDEKIQSIEKQGAAPPPQNLDNSNNQDGQQSNAETGTQQMFQELLKRMDTQTNKMDDNAATNRNRFDALEKQQTGAASQVNGIKDDLALLRQANTTLTESNALLMDRMDLLEGIKECGSPIRKFRRAGGTSKSGTPTNDDFDTTSINTSTATTPNDKGDAPDDDMETFVEADELDDLSIEENMQIPQDGINDEDIMDEAGSEPACGS